MRYLRQSRQERTLAIGDVESRPRFVENRGVGGPIFYNAIPRIMQRSYLARYTVMKTTALSPTMMDPAVKTALALCVVLGGFCAATLFRRDRPRPAPIEPQAEEGLLLRYRMDGPSRGIRSRKTARSATTLRRPWETPIDSSPATILTPSTRHEPPPSLSPDYPETDRPVSSRWGTSMQMMLPVAKPVEKTTHTVVDGDTLSTLAERYLGSSARANEIYKANRDILRDPSLLPIGMELKLPPRGLVK